MLGVPTTKTLIERLDVDLQAPAAAAPSAPRMPSPDIVTPILQSRNDGVLARLEALDQEIVKVSAAVPGKDAGNSALEEALEKGRAALDKALDAVRNVFNRQGPSASPSFSP